MHVTDNVKDKTSYMDKFLRPDDQRHSENVGNTVFLGKQHQPMHYERVCMYVHTENWVTETAKHFVLIPSPIRHVDNGARAQ